MFCLHCRRNAEESSLFSYDSRDPTEEGRMEQFYSSNFSTIDFSCWCWFGSVFSRKICFVFFLVDVVLKLIGGVLQGCVRKLKNSDWLITSCYKIIGIITLVVEKLNILEPGPPCYSDVAIMYLQGYRILVIIFIPLYNNLKSTGRPIFSVIVNFYPTL